MRAYQAIREVGITILPVVARLVDRRFILELGLGGVEQSPNRIHDLQLLPPVSTAKYPLGLEQYEQADQHLAHGGDLALDQALRALELRFVIANEEVDQHIGIETQHQRDRRLMATSLPPSCAALRPNPSRSLT